METLCPKEITVLVESVALYECEGFPMDNHSSFWKLTLWKFMLMQEPETWEIEYQSKKEPLEQKEAEPPLKAKSLRSKYTWQDVSQLGPAFC